MELTQHLPPSVTITGFDVSSAQFPTKRRLPPRLHLEVLDVLSENLPSELIDAFDVIHVRAFACVVQGGNPQRVMARLNKMLSMPPLSLVFGLWSIELSA